jgi:hypothetical protein
VSGAVERLAVRESTAGFYDKLQELVYVAIPQVQADMTDTKQQLGNILEDEFIIN